MLGEVEAAAVGDALELAVAGAVKGYLYSTSTHIFE